MEFSIDSSVLIAAERGRIQLRDMMADRGDEPLAISVITASELLHGTHRAKLPEQANRRQQFVDFILNLFPVAPVDLEVAHHHARVWAELQARGEGIGAHDLLIAASALAIEYGVLTFNADEFGRVPGLRVLIPSAD